MSRGFGSTFGAGTTDSIKTSATAAFASQFSFSIFAYVNGTGGSGAGRVFSRNTSAETLAMNGSTTSLKYTAPFSTTSGVFTFTIGSAGAWQHVLMTYDASSTANKPTVYVNGVAVSVTVGTAPVG